MTGPLVAPLVCQLDALAWLAVYRMKQPKSDSSYLSEFHGENRLAWLRPSGALEGCDVSRSAIRQPLTTVILKCVYN